MYIAMMTKERYIKIVNFSTSCASAWFMVDELSRVGFFVQGFGHIGDIFKNRLDIGPTNWVMKSYKLDDPQSLFSKKSGWFRAYHVFALSGFVPNTLSR